MKIASVWGVLLIASVTTGCDGGDSASEAAAPAAGSQQAPPVTATTNSAGARTGTVEIDGETWTIVPTIQCSVYPGPVVSVAGHAANNESIEITLDYSPDDGLVGATVEKSDGTLSWVAMGEQVTFDVDGDHIQGEGRFTWHGPGAAREAQGKFDLRCR